MCDAHRTTLPLGYPWAALPPSFPTHHALPSRTIQRTNYMCAAHVSACSSKCVAVCHTVICRAMMCTRPNNAPLAIELAIAFPEAPFPPCLIASASFSSFSWLKVCVSSSTRQASRCAASEESARSCRRRCKLREAQLDSQSTWPERPPPFADLRCRNWKMYNAAFNPGLITFKSARTSVLRIGDKG